MNIEHKIGDTVFHYNGVNVLGYEVTRIQEINKVQVLVGHTPAGEMVHCFSDTLGSSPLDAVGKYKERTSLTT